MNEDFSLFFVGTLLIEVAISNKRADMNVNLGTTLTQLLQSSWQSYEKEEFQISFVYLSNYLILIHLKKK